MDEPNVPEALALAREQGLDDRFRGRHVLSGPRDRDRDEEPRHGRVAGEAVRADGQERDSRHRLLQAAAGQRRRARRAGRNLTRNRDPHRFDSRGPARNVLAGQNPAQSRDAGDPSSRGVLARCQRTVRVLARQLTPPASHGAHREIPGRDRGCPRTPCSRSNVFSSAGRSPPISLTTNAFPCHRPGRCLSSQFKQLIVGKPISSHLAHHERLSRFTGLAVLSSDPLSSVAYATEEILRVLILVGVGALSLSSPIAFVIATILAVVVFSYRQTIHAYPTVEARTSSRRTISVRRRARRRRRLLIDYVLTVAVSIAAGVRRSLPRFQMASQPGRDGVRIRGRPDARQSPWYPRVGTIFALPTYFFVVRMLCSRGRGMRR